VTDPPVDPKHLGRDPAAPVAAPHFQDVYKREFTYVLHTLRRLGVAHGELEDVTHDCFVAIYRHFDTYDPRRPLRPWLFGFAFRVAADHRKLARHRHEAREPALEATDPLPRPDQLVEEEQLRNGLLAALDAMDFEKRSLIVMHDVEGMPVPEMARLLEVPLNTAYSRLRLARAELERHLVKILGGSRG
jgi:RNA polymerase sigma-70 factor, ECF subfamily